MALKKKMHKSNTSAYIPSQVQSCKLLYIRSIATLQRPLPTFHTTTMQVQMTVHVQWPQ